MTAKTGKAKMTKLLKRMASLYAYAYGLIERGKRSVEMIEVLVRALQMFKENRLGAVIERNEPGTELSHEKLQELVNLKFDDLPLPKRAKTFCRKYGIKYVIEWYVVCFSKSFKTVEAIRSFLNEHLGLPRDMNIDFDLVQPVYWSDPKFRRIMRLPLAQWDVCQDSGAITYDDAGWIVMMGEEYDVYYIAQFIEWNRRKGPFEQEVQKSGKLWSEKAVRKQQYSGEYDLHACVLVPPGLVESLPSEPPESYHEAVKLAAEHERQREVDRIERRKNLQRELVEQLMKNETTVKQLFIRLKIGPVYIIHLKRTCHTVMGLALLRSDRESAQTCWDIPDEIIKALQERLIEAGFHVTDNWDVEAVRIREIIQRIEEDSEIGEYL